MSVFAFLFFFFTSAEIRTPPPPPPQFEFTHTGAPIRGYVIRRRDQTKSSPNIKAFRVENGPKKYLNPPTSPLENVV